MARTSKGEEPRPPDQADEKALDDAQERIAAAEAEQRAFADAGAARLAEINGEANPKGSE